MRATIMYKAGDVRIENVPDAAITEPTDAVIRVSRACICGSGLWPLQGPRADARGPPHGARGHRCRGVGGYAGSAVPPRRPGHHAVCVFGWLLRVLPRRVADGVLPWSALWGRNGWRCPGGSRRVPLADGTLYKLPVGEDDALIPSLLTLSDVMGTGHHAAVVARVTAGKEGRGRRGWSRRSLRRHRRQAPGCRPDRRLGLTKIEYRWPGTSARRRSCASAATRR